MGTPHAHDVPLSEDRLLSQQEWSIVDELFSPKGEWSFREELFSPRQAERCTGLSLAMQRDWRRAEHLKQRPGVTYFTPQEMAEVRLMLRLRQLGMAPSVARPIAEQVAPSVIYQTVVLGTLVASVLPDIGSVRDARDDWTKAARLISGVQTIYKYGVLTNETFELVEDGKSVDLDIENEVVAVVNFFSVAAALRFSAGRPLFSLRKLQTFDPT